MQIFMFRQEGRFLPLLLSHMCSKAHSLVFPATLLVLQIPHEVRQHVDDDYEAIVRDVEAVYADPTLQKVVSVGLCALHTLRF